MIYYMCGTVWLVGKFGECGESSAISQIITILISTYN